jgi:pyruvate/2-oxoglutarate dehydrogenase complex dihydrolipoamide acyltransferase (E2) component
LRPDDTQGGTYTVTNVGTFGSVLVHQFWISHKLGF